MIVVVVVAIVRVVAAETLADAFGGAVEFVSMEMLASVITESLGPTPNVKREPADRKINHC